MTNAKIRTSVKAKRSSLSASYTNQCGTLVYCKLKKLKTFRLARDVGCYLASGNELPTSLIIRRLQKQNKNIFLPRVSATKKGTMTFLEHKTGVLLKNKWNIAEPTPSRSKVVSPRNLDIVITPLVACDSTGHRIGMGGGYYDKAFAFKRSSRLPKPILIGLAYEFQLVDSIIPAPWDIKLDIIITPNRIIHCRRSR